MQLDYLNPLILFPVLAALALGYYLLPSRFRWAWLLAASYAFYFWIGSWSIVVLLFSTLVNYLLGISLRGESGKQKKGLLLFGILLNLTLLLLFKYFTTLFAGSSWLAGFLATGAGKIIAPIGLSFYTLQNISYLVDVSKGMLPVERHIGIFALHTAFFPKILAGPIERGKSLLPQLHQPQPFDRQNVYKAVPLILLGLFKKVVIADRLALYVDKLFQDPGSYQGMVVWYGLVFLSFQIYLDFAGYTDMALGVARLFGIHLTPNFKRPYLSENIVEFWNRWHLSFSTWLRDYIFFPLRRFFVRLSGKSTGFLALVIPPLLTMLASGIWHGTGWTFVAWGLYHAVFYIGVISYRSWQGTASDKSKWLKWILVGANFVVISLGWILFRAASLSDAWLIFTNIFKPSTSLFAILQSDFLLDFQLSRLLIILVIIAEILIEVFPSRMSQPRFPWWGRWLFYLLLVLGITIFGVYPEGGSPFVYFKF